MRRRRHCQIWDEGSMYWGVAPMATCSRYKFFARQADGSTLLHTRLGLRLLSLALMFLLAAGLAGLSRSLLNFVGQALPVGQTMRLWQSIQRRCWRRAWFGELPEPFAMPRAAYRP